MKYFIGGVNASGKTTFLNKFKEKNPDWKMIKSSQAFMEHLNISGDYEKLRALPEEVKAPKLRELMENILQEDGDLMVDSHYLNIVKGQISPVTDNWIKGFDALVLLNISPETALRRIKQDDRDRALFLDGLSDVEKLEVYKDYIDRYQEEFKKLTNEYKIPSLVLDGEKELDEKMADFLRFHNSLKIKLNE